MLKDMDYVNRIIESHLFVDRMAEYGLDVRSQLAMARDLTRDFISYSSVMFTNEKFYIGGKAPAKEEIEKILEKIESDTYFANLNKAANYMNWVHNYSLILMCSVFEAFLVDAFREVISGVVNPVIEGISEEFLKRFEEGTIVSKLKVYNRILGISQNEFFDFSLFTNDVQKLFTGFKQQQFQELYMKRNQAAHNYSAVISKGELGFASEALQKLIINLVSKLNNKYGLNSQITLMAQGKNPYYVTG